MNGLASRNHFRLRSNDKQFNFILLVQKSDERS